MKNSHGQREKATKNSRKSRIAITMVKKLFTTMVETNNQSQNFIFSKIQLLKDEKYQHASLKRKIIVNEKREYAKVNIKT